MNQILVIAKNQETHFIKRLTDEVGIDRMACLNPWKASIPEAGNYPVGLVRVTGIYNDDKDLDCLKSFSGVLVNSLRVMEIFRRKSTQFNFYQHHNIPHLPWLQLNHHSFEEVDLWRRSNAPVDLVSKPDRGQGGREVRLHREKTFKRWYDSQKCINDLDYLVQPYIIGLDEYRFFFIEQEYFVLKRNSTQEFVANFQQGGLAVAATLPTWVIDELMRLASLSGAIYGAIDLFYQDRDLIILEFNSAPGVEQLEQVLGINIVGRLASKLLKFL